MIASFTLITFDNAWLLFIAASFLIFSLLAVVCAFILEDHEAIAAAELQNAVYTGAARLINELSLIIRQDGKVFYIDQDIQKLFFRNRKNGSLTLEDLYKAGLLSKKEKETLLEALQQGGTTTITLNVPTKTESHNPLQFSIEPIGILTRKERTRKLHLAMKPLARPSGYFLLKAPKESRQEKQDEKRESLLKKFPIATYSLKAGAVFDNMDDAFLKLLGYTREEFQITEFKRIFYDEDTVSKLLESKESWQTILPMKTKDNAVVSVFIDHRVLKRNSRSTGIVIPFVETEQLVADASTTSDDALDLVKNSPIATAILDGKGKVQHSNVSFLHMVRKSKSGQKQWNFLDHVHPDGREDLRTLLQDVNSGKIIDSQSVDVKLDIPGGSTASLYINRIVGKHGHSNGIIVHLIDTTELKNLELRFVHSQKMQAVGQLAGGIAHDFNNLLTAMMGFCDLLLIRHPAGDQSFADIMQIKQNANRAANLVRQLLAFSRKQTLQPKVTHITDVLADLSNLIGRLIGENIELNMEHGRDIGDVKVDQGQLEQVIINLAVNARDAMTEGGILTIRTSNIIVDEQNPLPRHFIPPAEDEAIENGEYVRIEVIDTGCGIEKDQIGKIFEPFYSTKELGAGTGLGLSTVYGIIKQTDGYIYVSSKVGKGTNFSLFLKRHKTKGETKTSKLIKEEPQAKAALTDLTGKGTILLVEDETPVRIFSFSALTGKGYTVLEADSAEPALRIIEERGKDIDVIITDVVMPGMSGPDMIKEITKQHPKIKVIFISGYGEDAFMESFGSERKFNFLSKPYTLKQLATKVKEVMEGE